MIQDGWILNGKRSQFKCYQSFWPFRTETEAYLRVEKELAYESKELYTKLFHLDFRTDLLSQWPHFPKYWLSSSILPEKKKIIMEVFNCTASVQSACNWKFDSCTISHWNPLTGLSEGLNMLYLLLANQFRICSEYFMVLELTKVELFNIS